MNMFSSSFTRAQRCQIIYHVTKIITLRYSYKPLEAAEHNGYTPRLCNWTDLIQVLFVIY